MTCHHSSYTKLTFIFFTIILILSCSPKEECISCSSKEKEGETEIGIIPIEDALANLNHFLADVNLLETKSGNKRSISSIDTHFSDFAVTKSGEPMPDAYLVNFNNDDGFAILGANTSITPIIAAVETGNTSWDKVLFPADEISFDNPDTDGDNEEEDDTYMEVLGPGLKSDQILSLCINSALYTKSGDERIGASSDSGTSPTPSKTEVLPLLTRDLFFDQNVTYCHKSKNRFVTNGCASTAISMIIAYKQYPRLTVDHEVLDYSQCGIADGLGLYYDFLDDDVFIKLDDYFTNSDILPDLTYFSDTDLYKLLERMDNKVIVKHNSPLSVYLNYPFYRTRFKLTSAVYYSLHNIIKSWDGTGVLPDAAVFGMKELGFSNVSRKSKTHLSDSLIQTIIDMLKADKPVLMCGWTLTELGNSHYWVVDGLSHTSTRTLIHCVWGHGNSNIGWFSTDCIRDDAASTVTKTSGKTNNEWRHLNVFSYDLKSSIPIKTINDFYDQHRIYIY